MIRILLFVLISFLSINCFAVPKKIVFFGDSLSDNGNLYRISLHLLPKSPPYYQGRFTNGPVWAEYVSNHLYKKFYMASQVYAVGGATAIYHQFDGKFLAPTQLGIEINSYLVDNLFKDKRDVLYVIWIGGNDYLFDQKADIDEGTTKVVEQIKSSIRKLMKYGANYFVLINLPDLSTVPKGRLSDDPERLHLMSYTHNQKLALILDDLKLEYPEARFVSFDIYNTMNDLMAHPEIYNKKYQLNITNTKDPCWMGGFFWHRIDLPTALRQELQTRFTPANAQGVDLKVMEETILHTPFYAYTYQMGKLYDAGILPCTTPEQYVFWDDVHPTAVMHKLVSRVVIEKLDEEFSKMDVLS